MRKPSAFRPLVMDRLEDRLVLSHMGKPSTVAAVRPHASSAAETIATNQVSDAYSIFVTNFTEAVNVDLYAPNVTGYANNLPMFTQQLEQELTTLEQSVVKTLGHQPAGTPAVTQLRQAIMGSSASSLKSRLSSLTLSSTEVGSPISSYEGKAIEVIEQSFTRVKQDVLAALPASTTASSASAT